MISARFGRASPLADTPRASNSRRFIYRPPVADGQSTSELIIVAIRRSLLAIETGFWAPAVNISRSLHVTVRGGGDPSICWSRAGLNSGRRQSAVGFTEQYIADEQNTQWCAVYGENKYPPPPFASFDGD